jgi:D-sedoheptulose 7-phosphate isomerase
MGLNAQDFRTSINETMRVLERLRDAKATDLERVAGVLTACVRRGGKILLCGNGGSAADSQHMATELTVRYLASRRAIPAIALTTDTSALTAAGNDLGFEHIFSRQVEALGQKGDVLIALSTSGTSPNVLRAVETARARHLVTVGLTGESGGDLASRVDHWIGIPSAATPRIQEAMLVAEHLLCEAVEAGVIESGT